MIIQFPCSHPGGPNMPQEQLHRALAALRDRMAEEQFPICFIVYQIRQIAEEFGVTEAHLAALYADEIRSLMKYALEQWGIMGSSEFLELSAAGEDVLM